MNRGIGLRFGAKVRVDRSALLFGAEHIAIASNVRIDAYSIITAEQPVRIGNFVHVGAGAMIFGKAGVVLEDFVGVSPRACIFSTADDYVEGYLANPTVPEEFTNVKALPVVMKKHSLLGCGSVLLPGVTVGEGAAIGGAQPRAPQRAGLRGRVRQPSAENRDAQRNPLARTGSQAAGTTAKPVGWDKLAGAPGHPLAGRGSASRPTRSGVRWSRAARTTKSVNRCRSSARFEEQSRSVRNLPGLPGRLRHDEAMLNHTAHLAEVLHYEMEALKSSLKVAPELVEEFEIWKTTTPVPAEPLVTVCVATYNRPHLLVTRCLQSIRAQTYEKLEIVVVGDGSGPETRQAVEKIDDPRITFFNLPERGHYPLNANRRDGRRHRSRE